MSDIDRLNALLDKLVVQATVLECDLHAEREAIVSFFSDATNVQAAQALEIERLSTALLAARGEFEHPPFLTADFYVGTAKFAEGCPLSVVQGAVDRIWRLMREASKDDVVAYAVKLRSVLRRIIEHPANNVRDLLACEAGMTLMDLAREALAMNPDQRQGADSPASATTDLPGDHEALCDGATAPAHLVHAPGATPGAQSAPATHYEFQSGTKSPTWEDGMESAAKLVDAERKYYKRQLDNGPAAGWMAKDRIQGVHDALLLVAKKIRDESGNGHQVNRERTDADYAIEFGGYLAEAAKLFMQSVAAVDVASQRHEDAEPGEEAAATYDVLHGQEELRSERWDGLRTAVYEFEKRRDRASQSVAGKEPK